MALKVLIACEESQAVCKAFRELGHEAYSCDIQDCSGGHPEWHIQGDVLKILNPNQISSKFYGIVFRTMDGDAHAIEGEWDLIIAHPPCTYMTKAGARWMYKRVDGKQYIDADRYWEMRKARNFFWKIVDARCHCICVENPRPLKICELPQPSQIIQPYQFGHPFSKETFLWLIHLPKLNPTGIIEHHTPWMPSNTGGLSRGKGGSKGVAHNAKTASKTFPGIAKAMAEQWGHE